MAPSVYLAGNGGELYWHASTGARYDLAADGFACSEAYLPAIYATARSNSDDACDSDNANTYHSPSQGAG
jgi:hypothetical protein